MVHTLVIFCCLINEAFFGAICPFVPFLGPRADGLLFQKKISVSFIVVKREQLLPSNNLESRSHKSDSGGKIERSMKTIPFRGSIGLRLLEQSLSHGW